MNDEILINVTPQETRVAVVQQGIVQQLHIERGSNLGVVSNVYIGRVKRVLPGMQSAFIDIGLERSAFLHVADIWENRNNSDTAKPIEKMLYEGQSLLVQVIKDSIGSKGARLSTQISIAGRLLVLLPQQQESHIGVSQRIEHEAERELLRAKLQQLLPDNSSGGYIIRTMAETATDKELLADMEYLNKLWIKLQEQAKISSAPFLLYQELNISLCVLRDYVNESTTRILVDSLDTYQRMAAFAQDFISSAMSRLKHYVGERSLFDLYGVEEEIERALSRRVNLKSGGYIIIDQTEALTTVDVNTGGFVGSRNFDDTIFKTNLDAAQVIARQLRLRNLGGIIICDFIDMHNQEHRDAVLEELKKSLACDHTRITVNGFSSLGLVEMTRKRTRESLAHILCESCPTCDGRGEVKTAQTICYEIVREITREARQFNAREYRILASQLVIGLFLDEESQSLAQLSDLIGKPVSLQVESLYSQEQYDIILM
ncbi:ribonuclease G [Candidatus Nitrotoga sp. M5]|uniref:ribonuclease G n=1 Tax=Candidatus Nitrotoga sp. M5 TaxID=2890409 RepID=UPI001EF2E47E|nr:ribonuclease G [Candidatus Nitrotoga sp. M5]CAH1386185.1 RNase G [Candidatus Nitrotoga sp. M5]